MDPNTPDSILKWLKLGLTVVFFLGLFYGITRIQGCDSKPVGTVTVEQLKTVTPTTKEKDAVPEGRTAIGTIKPKIKTNLDRSVVIDTSIVAHVDSKCNTCPVGYTEVDTVKRKFGFVSYPKFYVGYSDGLTLGYAHEFFRYGKLGLNATLTLPSVGLGLSHDITNNFFVMAGANIHYVEYNKIDDFSSYKFDVDKMKTVYPLGAFGFHF